MIKVLIHRPNHYEKWFGAEHLYRYGFVCGMQKEAHFFNMEPTEEHYDINYINGYNHGLKYHNKWKLKQLLRGKQS